MVVVVVVLPVRLRLNGRRLLQQQVAMLNSGAVRGTLRRAMHGGGNDFVNAADWHKVTNLLERM